MIGTVRLPALMALTAGACLVASACAGPEPAEAPAQEPQAAEEVSAEGTLAPPDRAQGAFTYDPAVAPEGARLRVEAAAAAGSTTVRLEVSGLLPDRGYAAHAHVRPCGPTGAAAGPHYQNQIDPAATPEQPSTDPAFANPRNEIWLDLRTDSDGNGEASTEVPFVFADRAPASVIVHEAEATSTAPGQAGSAGGRVVCLDVPFDQAVGG